MVVDFIQVGVAGLFWPIFNVADSAVTIGAGLLAWTYLFKDHD
jgi:signal peptidase II